MTQRNHLYRFLMLLSLFLLVVFQAYWLRKVYQEQKELLNKEIDNIFVQGVRDMQDSIFRAGMLYIGKRDSTDVRQKTIIVIGFDSLADSRAAASPNFQSRIAINQRFFFRLDSSRGHHERTEPHVSLKAASEPESRLQRRERFFLNALAAVREQPTDSEKTTAAVADIFSDTLHLGNLQSRVQGDMARAGLNMPVKISREGQIPNFPGASGIVTFYPAGMPPVHLYVARASGSAPFLFRKMVPSLLFAFFLIGITFVSFLLIFRSLQEQHKLAKLKNDFIGNITHELKTPISTVSVALEALQNFQVLENQEKTREYLSISQHELQRLSILVDRVLKMSMFENKTLQLHKERFDIRAALEKILQSMGLQFEKVNARVQLIVEGEHFMIEGDPVHLTNVFYNLLDNALKYSPSSPDVEIGLRESNGMVQVSVKDKGIGIEKEYQDKIFEQFFRAPQEGNRHNTKGYGLGLSYVSEVVRSHHGEISVKSVPGKGSTFTVRVPRHQVAA